MQQGVGELVGCGKAASAAGHVKVDDDGEPERRVLVERAGDGAVQVVAEMRPIDGDAEGGAEAVDGRDGSLAEAEVVADFGRLALGVHGVFGVALARQEWRSGHAGNVAPHGIGQVGVEVEEGDEVSDAVAGCVVKLTLERRYSIAAVSTASCGRRVLMLSRSSTLVRNKAASWSSCSMLGLRLSLFPVADELPRQAEAGGYVVLGEASIFAGAD